jgi:hypothetical protein
MPDARSHVPRRTPRVLAALAAPVLAAPVLALALGMPAAQAAVPDAVGFALYSPASATLPDAWPATTTVSSLSPGHYVVRFPGTAARGGVVHVTAVQAGPHWCQAEKWTPSGTDELVYVGCYKAGGVPDVSGFSVIFTSSSGPLPSSSPAGGRYGYVDAKPTGGVISQYNSVLATNSVTHLVVGSWLVKMPGLSTPAPRAGGLQATAVNSEIAAFCKVVNWTAAGTDQQIQVACFSRSGAPLDTEFTLSFQYQRALYGAAYPPKVFGYLGNLISVGPAGGATNFNSITGTASNSLLATSLGNWEAFFPSLAVRPDNVQVTSAGSSLSFCALTAPWSANGIQTVVKTVACYTINGTPVGSDFLVSDNSIY